MLKVIAEGISYGLFLSILVGPLLMTLVNTAIKSGYKKGLAVAAGIWLSDVLIIWILFDLSTEFNAFLTADVLKILAAIASITFVTLGLMYFLRNRSSNEAKFSMPDTFFWQCVKGFLINTINPFTFVFWTTLMANNMVWKNYDTTIGILFFTTIMAVIIFTDSLKVALAHKISPILKTNVVVYLQYFSGTIFILSGVYIFLKFFY